jgi:hypothetical protein
MHPTEYWKKAITLDALVAAIFISEVVTGSATVMFALMLLFWGVIIGRIYCAFSGGSTGRVERPAGFMLYHIPAEATLIFALIGNGDLVTGVAYLVALVAFEVALVRGNQQVIV